MGTDGNRSILTSSLWTCCPAGCSASAASSPPSWTSSSASSCVQGWSGCQSWCGLSPRSWRDQKSLRWIFPPPNRSLPSGPSCAGRSKDKNQVETLICLNLCSSPNPRCDEMEKVGVKWDQFPRLWIISESGWLGHFSYKFPTCYASSGDKRHRSAKKRQDWGERDGNVRSSLLIGGDSIFRKFWSENGTCSGTLL